MKTRTLATRSKIVTMGKRAPRMRWSPIGNTGRLPRLTEVRLEWLGPPAGGVLRQHPASRPAHAFRLAREHGDHLAIGSGMSPGLRLERALPSATTIPPTQLAPILRRSVLSEEQIPGGPP